MNNPDASCDTSIANGEPTATDTARIGVVIVNFHGLGDTLECLRSCELAADDAVDLIVVDNGSGDGEAEHIAKAFPSVRVIAHDQNAGWSGGNNLGIRAALQQDADWVLLLNNDTIVSPELFSVLRAAVRERSYGVVGPIINEYDEREQVQTEGVRFNPADEATFFAHVSVQPGNDDARPSVVPCDIVNGCAVMISRQVLDQIGLIDERFFLICEESDFCLRAAAAGFPCGVVDRSLVWHKHSASFARAGSPLQRYYGARNLGLLLAKHPVAAGRKSKWASRLQYARHLYHLYCHEREWDNAGAARAVVDGWADHMCRRYGKRRQANWLVTSMAGLLDAGAGAVWRLRGGRTRVQSDA